MFSPRSWLATAITGALISTVVAVPATAASTLTPAKVTDPVAHVDPTAPGRPAATASAP
ncbi:hypothetical protein [Nonomuraea rubra]|uniref:Uncharacterized protein n=1 Tax=Nonomuraea rubra TaxID=46180 RepID=A0A7X0P7N9_9ACTN|nr:hypothetical protein [Nonomuraea rubra]MBB6556596.1 hypothetical protein [Nonomuraea rubra]